MVSEFVCFSPLFRYSWHSGSEDYSWQGHAVPSRLWIRGISNHGHRRKHPQYPQRDTHRWVIVHLCKVQWIHERALNMDLTKIFRFFFFYKLAGGLFRFRLNWGAGGKRIETSPEFSIFVGDLAPDVTDVMLQNIFQTKYPSTIGAKVGEWVSIRLSWTVVFHFISLVLGEKKKKKKSKSSKSWIQPSSEYIPWLLIMHTGGNLKKCFGLPQMRVCSGLIATDLRSHLFY